MEAFGKFLDGYAHVGVQLWEHLREKTFAALNTHAALKTALTTPEAVRERAAYVRGTFLASLGGLPEGGQPLNARLCGRVRRAGYVIEKIIFESQPQVYVTGLVYLPEACDRPAPGILFLSGHHREAKGNPEYQRVCHDLVTNGFVVLAIDPTGQGERVTHLDPDTGAMAVEWGTTEHSYQGQQCILTGTSIARYFLFDALRGIDYLQGRPEVDPDRIGVTGSSGGGTQTSLVCTSGDPRVKAAVPCTYVTSREHYYLTGQAQDPEQLQFGMTRDGINFDDFFLPFAPRPLLIGAVRSDFFNPEGTELTYQRLKRLYGILGAEDRVQRVFAPGGHAYCRELRQAAVNWFRRHLLDKEPDFVSPEDGAIETLPDQALWCTGKGHVPSDFPGARTPYHCNLAVLPRRAPYRDPKRLRDRVIAALGIRERLESTTPLFPRTLREQEENGIRADSIFFLSEPGVMAAGCLVRAAGSRPRRTSLLLTQEGTARLDREIAKSRGLLDTGEAVFVFDVRGKGAVKTDPVNAYADVFPSSFFHTDGWLAWSAYCLGESLLGMRVFDVLRAAQYLRDEAHVPSVDLWAEGLEPALWGYLAAALDSGIERTRVAGLIESFESIVRDPLYRKDFTPPMLIHGVLREFDLPDLQALFEGRNVAIS
jgi:hypothetical protein